MFLAFQNGVKNIQTSEYNDTGTVSKLLGTKKKVSPMRARSKNFQFFNKGKKSHDKMTIIHY